MIVVIAIFMQKPPFNFEHKHNAVLKGNPRAGWAKRSKQTCGANSTVRQREGALLGFLAYGLARGLRSVSRAFPMRALVAPFAVRSPRP
jgi:hypothetical protein